EHSEKRQQIAQLPGDLFGSGSGLGSGPSRRDAALPEGRPGAAGALGPRRPRVSRGHVGSSPSVGGGEATGINPIPAPGGVRLPEEGREEVSTWLRRGAPSDFGERGGKGTPVASLPSTGPEAPGRGSAAAPSGGGAGGGYGASGPRAFGGSVRPGRSRPHGKTGAAGDGATPASGYPAPAGDSGISIPGAGGGSSGWGSPSRGGGSAGGGLGGGERPGKRLARADLPLDGPGDGGRGAGQGRGAGAGTGPAVESGPKSFAGSGKRRSTGAPGAGTGSGRHKGKGGSAGDAGGVSLPSGGGANDDP